MYYTTLKAIRACCPCQYDLFKLLCHLGKAEPDDEPLSILTILEFNGIADALCALQAVNDPACERDARLFSVRCAQQVQHLLKDKRVIDALHVAELHSVEVATDGELRDACGVACAVWEEWNEAEEAIDAAYAAVCAASSANARERACDAACSSACAAAHDACNALGGGTAKAVWEATWDTAHKAAWAAHAADFRAIFCAED